MGNTPATVEQILITGEEGASISSVPEVVAHAGRGLEGDRYYEGKGKFKKLEPKRQATLIEIEAIEAVERDYGIDIEASDVRRNIVTRGIALNHLVGKTFKVGDATLKGIKLCEPCAYMQKLAGKPIRDPLKHRGGLNAEILEGGPIRVGDAVAELD
jgi:MOSC domain-containing protein YiiM